MKSDIKIAVERTKTGFEVSCLKNNGVRIPLKGFCSHENIRLIKQEKPGSDPVGEVVDVMRRTLSVWGERGLI